MKTVIEMAREVLLLDERDNPNDDGIAQFIGTLTDFAELARADERNRTWTQEHWTGYERSIVAAEREVCAKFVDHILKEGGGTWGDAIRARGNT